jgi:predicted transcriptional regulator
MRRYAMLIHGVTQTRVAVSLGCSQGLVSQVVNGTKRSAAVERRISRMLRIPRSTLWDLSRRRRKSTAL